MKILVIGDLHGRKPKIPKIDFDCIVQVGDVCSDKEFRPFIKKWFKLLQKDRDNTPSMDEFIIQNIGKKKANEMDKKSLLMGREIIKYLDSFEKPVFFVPGNWDQSYGKTKIKDIDKNDFNYMSSFYDFYLSEKSNSKLIKGLKNIIDLQFNNKEFLGMNFLGYGLSSANESTKLRKKRLDLTKNQFKILNEKYKKLFSKLFLAYNSRNRKSPTIFITHNIPYETKLDIVKDNNSYANKRHLGSYIAKEFCEKYKPLLCIGGHVHEGRGQDKIGKTVVINPGFGEKAIVLMEIDENKGKIKKIKFFD